MILASDSGIDAGAIQHMGLRQKPFVCRRWHCRTSLPFVHLVESAGANLMKYRVEGFVLGGSAFSQSGSAVCGRASGNHGAAWLRHGRWCLHAGLERCCHHGERVVRGRFWQVRHCSWRRQVRWRPKKNWAVPRCIPAVSGLGEYLAEDDRHALWVLQKRPATARTGNWTSVAMKNMEFLRRGSSCMNC
jgi:geranyl-CoA carboxylase beta subunit